MSQSLSDEEQALAAGYVLGDLSDEEQTQIEALLQQRPEFRQEVNALQISLQMIPHALSEVDPPPHLQADIIKAHDAMTGVTEPTFSTRQSFPWSKLIAGIALLTALIAMVDNLRLRRQFSLAQDIDTQRVATILQQPNSRLIALQSEDGSAAAGTLLFTPGQWQEVVVSLGNLPPLPVEQVYRMWLELENGDIIFCGEFNTTSEGDVFVRFTPPETPPQGVKATGIFVTTDATAAPLIPGETRIIVGEI